MQNLSVKSTIRPIQASDAQFIHELLSSQKMCTYLPFNPMTSEQTDERMHSYLDLNRVGKGQGCWIIEVDGQQAGYGFIRPYHWGTAFLEPEIGVLIHPNYWNHRIGSSIVKYMIQQYPVNQVLLAVIHLNNLASEKLFRTFGFNLIGPCPDAEGYRVWKFHRKD